MATIGARERLETAWTGPYPALVAWLATVDHKRIGYRYVVTALAFFLVGGIEAILLRTQLAQAESEVLGAELYNQVFTMHGTTMIFLFATPMLIGIGNYVVPLMLGTRDMAFPRLNALSYWIFLLAGLFLNSSFIVGAAPDGGWFNYVPLTGSEFSVTKSIDFWGLGIIFLGISTTGSAINFIVTILKLRAPGMAVHRMPILAWTIFETSLLILIALPSLTVAAILLELDRLLGTHFYDPAAGGSSVLWQHLFWFWGHPEVYILLLPALGIVSTIVEVYSRRPIFTYSLIVVAGFAIAALSLTLWVHHMFAVGLPLLPLTFFSVASFSISIASGISIFAWLATLGRGTLVWKPPLLFVLGFIFVFVIGGITGVMVAVIPFDWQVHDSYFVVAHFHYVLVGGVVYPILGGIYHWFPKVTGRLLSDRVGHVSFWLIFIGFNVTFFTMHLVGMEGMPRRVATYLESTGWETYNLIQTIGSYILLAGMLLFAGNLIWSRSKGPPAGDNPHDAATLEWATTSPPVNYNFERLPIVHGRNPLWDEGPGEGGRAYEFSDEPFARGREAVATAIIDGTPQAAVRFPRDAYTPAVIAAGLAVFFGGAIAESLWAVVSGVILTSLGASYWMWRPSQNEPSRIERLGGEGLPSGPRVSLSLGRWGMVSLLVTETVLFGSLFSSYFFLRGEAGSWPPDGISPPALTMPLVLTAIIGLGSVSMVWAHSAGDGGRVGRMQAALALTIILGLAFLGLQGFEYSRSEFTWTENAYSSIFFVITGAHGAHMLIGVLMTCWLLVRSWFVPETGERAVSLRNISLYWHFVSVIWLLVLGIVYVWARWL